MNIRKRQGRTATIPKTAVPYGEGRSKAAATVHKVPNTANLMISNPETNFVEEG